MKYFFPLLSLLLSFTHLPLHAQEDTTDRYHWSREGWAIGVGGLAAYSPLESPGLDDFYALHGFGGYTPSPLRFSTYIFVARPSFWFEFEFGYRLVSEEEVDGWGIIRSEGTLVGLRFGYPINDPGSTVRIVPNLGLLGFDTSLDLLTDTENSPVRTHRDLRTLMISPSVTLNIKAHPAFWLQLSGGYSLPVTTSWSDMDRDIEPVVEVDGGPDIRIGLMLNLIDEMIWEKGE